MALPNDVDVLLQALLIGRRGQTITRLQEEYGCAVEVNKGARTATIAGPSDAVPKAAAEIHRRDPSPRSSIHLLKLESKLELGGGRDPRDLRDAAAYRAEYIVRPGAQRPAARKER